MAEGDEGRPPASADLLDSLSRRIHELSSQLADARGELAAARKRVEVYEAFDETIQGALTGALRAAYDIRVRAEQSAATLVADARAEREHVVGEIARLRREREQLRTAGGPEAAGLPGTPRVVEDSRLLSLRARASEVLAGLLDEFAAETAHAAAGPAPVVPQREMPADPVASPSAAVGASLEGPSEFEPVVSRPAAFARLVEAKTPRVPATPPPTPVAQPPAMTRAAADQPDEERPDEERPDEERPDEIEVVISQVPAFARLVEVELRLQELPNVRTAYVRDYRDGVLRLVVGLVAPSTARELGEIVANIARPRLAVLGSSRATLELRLEGEASVA